MPPHERFALGTFAAPAARHFRGSCRRPRARSAPEARRRTPYEPCSRTGTRASSGSPCVRRGLEPACRRRAAPARPLRAAPDPLRRGQLPRPRAPDRRLDAAARAATNDGGGVAAEAERQLEHRSADEPYMFVGLPGALCGAHDDIVLWKPGERPDWELELAVVIGRAGWKCRPSAPGPRRRLHDRQRHQRPRRAAAPEVPDDGLPDQQEPADATSRPVPTSCHAVRPGSSRAANRAPPERRDDAGRGGERHHLRGRAACRLCVADDRHGSRET